jgi:hypothetical protein
VPVASIGQGIRKGVGMEVDYPAEMVSLPLRLPGLMKMLSSGIFTLAQYDLP